MIFRVKAYHKIKKRIYKVASINWATNSISIFEGPKGFHNYDLSEIVLFQATTFSDSKNIKIYEGDFIVAKNKDGRCLTGIISRNKNGTWILKNKKLKKQIPLYFLFVDPWNVRCLKNAFMYFSEIKKENI